VYVAYAMQDAAKHDPVPQAGSGVVDVFDQNGNFVKRFAANGTLNAPWGVVMAPATFGPLAGNLLIGNFGDGTINAFDANGGQFLGQAMDSTNHAIVNPGLWDMVFGQGGTGDSNTLYFTAGGSDQTSGVFGTLVPSEAAAGGSDFSLSLSAQSLSVPRGGSGSLTVSASSSGGFNSPISLSCSGVPAGLNCSFSPATITPGSSAAQASLNIAAASTYSTMGMLTLLPFVWGFTELAGTKRKGASRKTRWLRRLGLGMVALLLVVSLACCGSAGSSRIAGNNATVMVTGTSGALSHSIPVTLTVQ
jgi:hypothetical protein